ncbi:MAG: AMP-binding protein [Lachnospiraceae bacterium]|nr:AMP-binding protein [Lachnospiraceae bacterium]
MEFKRVTEFLDKAVQDVPEKIGFVDEAGEMTYKQMQEASFKVARAILKTTGEDRNNLQTKEPEYIATLIEAGNDITACFHGILYAGDAYSCIDETMPNERIEKVFDTLKPVILLTNRKLEEKARSLNYDGTILVYEDIIANDQNDFEIPKIIEEDVSYKVASVIFTSGSTGNPKGVLIGHNTIVYCSIANRDDVEVIFTDHVGNQSPLYYVMGVLNLYFSIAAEATCYFMPKWLFSQPAELVKYLVEKQISIIDWVASGVTVISRFSAWEGYEEELNKCLRTVTFAGDVASTKLINKMKKVIPDPKYRQGYGASEFFYTFLYTMTRDIPDDEMIPLGYPAEFVTAYVIKDDGTLAAPSEEGQLCLAGPGLALGYLNDEATTAEKFQDNPVKPGERILCTGDIVEENEYGEIIFKTRRDFMVKQMGHRVELGEIELAASSLDDTMQCACIFDKSREKIIMVYVGKYEEKELRTMLKDKLPKHMIPREFVKLDVLPLNQNNKIDRKKLQEIYIK